MGGQLWLLLLCAVALAAMAEEPNFEQLDTADKRRSSDQSSGISNKVSSSYAATVGGISNNIEDGGHFSLIHGGEHNRVHRKSPYVSIAGGFENTISDLGSQQSQSSTLTGGKQNYAKAINAAVVGGGKNHLYSNYAFMAGGFSNKVIARFSAVLGGQLNTVALRQSFSMGFNTQIGINGYTEPAAHGRTMVLGLRSDEQIAKLNDGRCKEEKSNIFKVCGQTVSFDAPTVTINGKAIVTQGHSCSLYVCRKPGYHLKENAADIRGHSDEVCCKTACSTFNLQILPKSSSPAAVQDIGPFSKRVMPKDNGKWMGGEVVPAMNINGMKVYFEVQMSDVSKGFDARSYITIKAENRGSGGNEGLPYTQFESNGNVRGGGQSNDGAYTHDGDCGTFEGDDLIGCALDFSAGPGKQGTVTWSKDGKKVCGPFAVASLAEGESMLIHLGMRSNVKQVLTFNTMDKLKHLPKGFLPWGTTCQDWRKCNTHKCPEGYQLIRNAEDIAGHEDSECCTRIAGYQEYVGGKPIKAENPTANPTAVPLGTSQRNVLEYTKDDAFTIEAWIKTNSKDQTIVHNKVYDSHSSNTNNYFAISLSSGRFLNCVFGGGGAWPAVSVSTPILQDQWTHVTCVREASGRVGAFVNGKEGEIDNKGGINSESAKYVVKAGKPQLGQNPATSAEYLSGAIRSVRFTKGKALYPGRKEFLPPKFLGECAEGTTRENENCFYMDNGKLKAAGEVKKMDDGTAYIVYPGGTRTAAQIGDPIGSVLKEKTQEEAIAICSSTPECVAVHEGKPKEWNLRKAGENSFVSECCSQNQCFNDKTGVKEDCPKDCDGNSYCAGLWIYFPSCADEEIPDGSSPNGCAAGNSGRRLHTSLIDLTARVDDLIARAKNVGRKLEQ